MNKDKLPTIVFEAALGAIRAEDELLRAHCAKPCGYHHGISPLSETILMYFVFRTLINRQQEYKVRLEQPYPNPSRRYLADLVILQDDNNWVGCVEGKWLNNNAQTGCAKDDIQRMKENLGPSVTKLLLALWVKEPGCEKKIDHWLDELSEASGTESRLSGSFKTLWSAGMGPDVTLREVEAGVTLFEVE